MPNANRSLTVFEFCDKYGITMTSVAVPSRTDMLGDEWDKKAFHYIVTLRRGPGKVMSTFYSKGSGHVRNGRPIPPNVIEVVAALAMDAQSIVTAPTFEEWANENGYDEDSRRAEAIWKGGAIVTQNLRRFLDHEAFLCLTNDVDPNAE